MRKVVISIGGSVLVPDKNDAEYIGKLAEVLLQKSKSCQLFIVAGGGKIARYYIKTGRALGVPDGKLDELGIGATRLNAGLLISALGRDVNPEVPKTVEDAARLGESHAIVVMGGTVPGHTTDAVSAALLEAVDGDVIINASGVNGVYSDDPKKNPDAVKYDRMKHQELVELTSSVGHTAGPTVIFDPKGSEIVSRLGKTLLVLNGRGLEALENAIDGQDFDGTVIE